MNLFLEKSRLWEFLRELAPYGALHGPTLLDRGVLSFARVDSPDRLCLAYQRTLIPPKKYLLPFREEILNYAEGSYRIPASTHPDILLFGIHPCDLKGIAYLDRVFLGESPDPLYAQRRARLTLIGLSCQPDDYCFCGESAESPCDLFLDQVEGGFMVASFSEKGEEMLGRAGHLSSEGGRGAPFFRGSAGYPLKAQDPQLRFSEDPLWGKFAETCVSCGACSVCCPTCYCFDVREYPFSASAGVRMREWDNCLFKTHGEVSGGNFRTTRLERLRYRFLHKYCGFSPLEGLLSCVGCGRCRKACPVEIDLRELFPA
jgi:sulfhydrogenase subunit beta (sulfur reductase)